MRELTDPEMCLLRAADYEASAERISLAPDREALLEMARYWRRRAAQAGERARWACKPAHETRRA